MIVEMQVQAIQHIALHLRACDKAEIFALRYDSDPYALAEEATRTDLRAVALAKDGEPVAGWGVKQMWPGVWSVFLMATPRWPEVMLSVTRHIRKELIPTLDRIGWHRAECASLTDHKDAHRWLEALGAKREAQLSGYGRGAQDFYLYVWRK